MFGSEVLDSAVIGASAALLGVLITGIFSYFIAYSSKQAEKLKTVHEKQLEAFREIYTSISVHIENVSNVAKHCYSDEITFDEAVHKTTNTADEVKKLYYKNLLYIPNDIDDNIIDLMLKSAETLKVKNKDEFQKRVDEMMLVGSRLLEGMQKHIGLQ